jgi:Na+/H+ antiporter NhaD/arsenite permease-like protein
MLWPMAVSEWSRAIAVAAFVGSYVGLALGRVPGFRIDRTGVAIIGAAVMVASGAVPWPDAVASVDAPTLVLLFGMMIVTAYLRLSGFFRLVMTWALRRARTPLALLATVVAASGVLSAFFVNDVVCLVLAPVVLEATRQLALPPVPYLVALVTAANVGSVATLTGNPQNMLVGSFSGISYRSFLAREGPIAVVGLVCVYLAVAVIYRRRLPNAPLEIVPDTRLAVHYPLMWKTIAATTVMLIAFLAGVPIAVVAIAGAAWTLFTRRVNPEKVYREINWALLVLFAGLFVVTAGLEHTGLVDVLLRWAAAANLQRPVVLTIVTAVLSNIVSNVPAVLLFKPLVTSFDEPRRAWLVLAMASTLAGNLTILGSVANLIVVEAARAARVEIGFIEYCKVGVPVTLVTLFLGWLLLAWF